MKIKINILILFLGLLSISMHTVIGQEQTIKSEESSIVLSEATITSIAALLYQYKKENQIVNTFTKEENFNSSDYYENNSSLEFSLLQQEIEALKNRIADHNTPQLNKDNYNDAYSTAFKKDLKNLEYEISKLSKKTNNNSRIPSSNSVIVVKPEFDKNESQLEYSRIQKQLDSLLALQVVKTEIIRDTTDYANEFFALQLKLQELQSNLTSNNSKPTDYSILKGLFKDYNKQIYFANNSVSLQMEASKIIQDVYTVLEKHENIDVLIKGYASNKGLPSTNEKVSMLRTETVKKALILKGIHPSRILTQYHGIDYETTNENDARRVDISLIIRK